MTSYANDLAAQRLNYEEGRRRLPYKDSKGLTTIGVGINLDAGLDDEEIDWLLAHRLERVETALSALSWYGPLNDVRKSVFLDLGFNMGVSTLLAFHNTLAAVQAGNWQAAHDGLLASKWHTDVGDRRALPLAQMLLTGVLA
jgi:lysozyme